MGRFKTIEPTRNQTQELLVKFKRLYEVNPSELLIKTIASLEQKHKSMLNSEMTEFMNTHWKSDWWQVAMMQYSITEVDGQFKVISKTRGWEIQPEWHYSHKFEAIEKVQKLVYWKDHDRDRGIGDRDRDFEYIVPLKMLMTAQLSC